MGFGIVGGGAADVLGPVGIGLNPVTADGLAVPLSAGAAAAPTFDHPFVKCFSGGFGVCEDVPEFRR
jgi:hypothetical protein